MALTSPGARSLAAALLAAAVLAAAAGLVVTARAAVPQQLARGAVVAQRFCMSCHRFESTPGTVGLRRQLRPEAWPSAEVAYAQLGQLWRVNGAMTFRFEGSDEDRRALGIYLAYVAERNRVSPWRKVVAGLPLVVVVVGAALWARSLTHRARVAARRR